MSLLWLQRFGAVCGIILGLSLGIPGIVEAFTGETTATSFVIGFGAAFGVPGLTAFYLAQRSAFTRSGALAFAVNVIGLGLFGGVAFALNLVLFFLDEAVVTDLMAGPTRIAILTAAGIFILGTVLFGVSMARARVLPLIPVLAYTITLPLLAALASLPDSLFTSALHVVGGGSVVWLSEFARRQPLAPEPNHP